LRQAGRGGHRPGSPTCEFTWRDLEFFCWKCLFRSPCTSGAVAADLIYIASSHAMRLLSNVFMNSPAWPSRGALAAARLSDVAPATCGLPNPTCLRLVRPSRPPAQSGQDACRNHTGYGTDYLPSIASPLRQGCPWDCHCDKCRNRTQHCNQPPCRDAHSHPLCATTLDDGVEERGVAS
jgi:hypothetical protein